MASMIERYSTDLCIRMMGMLVKTSEDFREVVDYTLALEEQNRNLKNQVASLENRSLQRLVLHDEQKPNLKNQLVSLDNNRSFLSRVLPDEQNRNLKTKVQALFSNENPQNKVRELERKNEILERKLERRNGTNVALREELKCLENELESLQRTKVSLEESLRETYQSKQLLEGKVDSLEQQIADHSFGGSYSDSSATPPAFEAALSQANEAIQNFSSALASEHESLASDPRFSKESHTFARKSHWKLAVRWFLGYVLFQSFECEGFGVDSNLYTGVLDAKAFRDRCFEDYKRLHEEPEVAFRDREFIRLLREKMRILRGVFRDKDPYTEPLKEKMHKMIFSVWKLHKLALSLYPPPRIIRVANSMDMDVEYMENVISGDDIDKDEYQIVNKIAFMVFPGFSIRNSVFKCQVYPLLRDKEESKQRRKSLMNSSF